MSECRTQNCVEVETFTCLLVVGHLLADRQIKLISSHQYGSDDGGVKATGWVDFVSLRSTDPAINVKGVLLFTFYQLF